MKRRRARARPQATWTVRTLARELRELQAALSHPIAGPLQCRLDWRGGPLIFEADQWTVFPCTEPELVGVPGFDATASARRLLARWRDIREASQLSLFP